MTRSIFDPDGGETERSGSRNLGPDADQISHLPEPETTDDELDDEAAQDTLASGGASGEEAYELRRERKVHPLNPRTEPDNPTQAAE